ncbi:C1 family peptidase (plasmid) [Deinococcus sp. KNUC1210]|uniref:C1 family peptidase n=1 Tax=Deinococcus sp. KNUC1210 TaxID=2917691 RepID=UPI001EEFD276|nr:C1 family peptidase [Deinococcus sp. KNUC1210]ULH17655.1 C1 family peptidase [Deinococcus sp. KNUC1210]
MKRLLLLVAVLLSACGGPASTPGTNADLLTETNAWTGDIPADAQMVTPEEFRAGLANGSLVLTPTSTLETQRVAREKQYQDDLSFLSALPDKSPYLQELLAEAAGTPHVDEDRPVKVAGGQSVLLMSLATQLRNAVDTEQRSQSVDNALGDYTQSYELLPEGLRAGAASPDSLRGKSLAEVRAALSALNAQLSSVPGLDGTRLDTQAGAGSLPTTLSSQAVNAGNGTDNDGPCTPTGLVKRYWFPLKNFVSPIKNQGNRGTCWAFTAIGALESRERVQNNNPADLSEQFLVNKVKQDWDSSDDEDGYLSDKALDTAVSKGQLIPSESAWTYNPANMRKYPKYDNTCTDYSGDCSATAHESRRTCTVFIFKFCSYTKVNFAGPGVSASRTTLLWKNGKAFDLNLYRLRMAQGYTLLADFPVFVGVQDRAAGGVVSDYSQTKIDAAGKEVAGSYGGHAVQLVGFLSNDDMAQFGNPAKVGGGGYFILKNSWGCLSGDGGYYYVPADYVQKYFGSLRTLNFDARRSGQWTQEQQIPGGTEAPVIIIKNPVATADVQAETDLAQFFTVTHPVASVVNLTVTSSVDGPLYNGPWNIASGGFGGPELKRTFTTTGTRTISLLVKYGSSQASAHFTVDVVNAPPRVILNYTGNPYQATPYSISATITDTNEGSATDFCVNTTWQVDTPDVLREINGCQVEVTFGTTGKRQVRVSTHDRLGATTNETLTLNVLPAQANPYPKITYSGVYDRDAPRYDVPGCTTTPVIQGDTLNLTWPRISCSGAEAGPTVYYGKAILENPQNEALAYAWTLYVSGSSGEYVLERSTEAIFNLFNASGQSPITTPCRITLTVSPPDPSRSKSLTVWNGKCTYNYGTILK